MLEPMLATDSIQPLFPYGNLVIKESVVSEQPRLVDQSLTVERATRLSDPTTGAPAPNESVLIASRSQLQLSAG